MMQMGNQKWPGVNICLQCIERMCASIVGTCDSFSQVTR